MIGEACLVSDNNLPVLYQSHILKFRLKNKDRLTPALLLAALTSDIVKTQIKSKQFTADIIDTIGNRYTELRIPIPKNKEKRAAVGLELNGAFKERVELLGKITKLPLLAQRLIKNITDKIPEQIIEGNIDEGDLGQMIKISKILNNIFLPKYYSDSINLEAKNLKKTHDLVKIEDLVKDGIIELETGIEIGKMAYGTGQIPFIRTSDLSNWELKIDSKQGISEEIYDKYKF